MRVGFKLETAPPFTVIAPPAVKDEVFEIAGQGSAPRPPIRVAVAERVGGGLVTEGIDTTAAAAPPPLATSFLPC